MGADRKKREAKSVEMFTTPSGIKVVDSHVRMRLLSILMEKDTSFGELVESVGKVKSTVSAHLKSLTDEGIVGWRADPVDSRKKIYYMKSNYLGGLIRRRKVEKDIEDYFAKVKMGQPDPYTFYRLVFATVRVSMYHEGISIDPVLYASGRRIGEAVYEQVAAREIDDLIENLRVFYLEQRLGNMVVESVEPFVALKVVNCFECIDLPVTGQPACAFESGLLTAVFTLHRGVDHMAIETNCYSMGDDHCRFEVRTLGPADPKRR